MSQLLENTAANLRVFCEKLRAAYLIGYDTFTKPLNFENDKS
jgi:hypothetical protein